MFVLSKLEIEHVSGGCVSPNVRPQGRAADNGGGHDASDKGKPPMAAETAGAEGIGKRVGMFIVCGRDPHVHQNHRRHH